MEVVLEMPFLAFNNADVEFSRLEKLTWRFYTLAKALSTISQVKFINMREFTKTVLDENSETFLIHVIILEAETFIFLLQIAQITALR